MIISPVVLLILDGWGFTRNYRGNAIHDAYTPTIDRISAFHPSLTLQASGFSVGMIWGEPGNSATGHACLGTGRIAYNHLPRILREIQNGNFFENPVLCGAVTHTQKNKSVLHIAGLVSGATTHSYLEHLYALFELARKQGAPVLLHVFTDGRDSAPRQAIQLLEALQERISEEAYPVRIATLIGRCYAMNRTGAWEYTQRAYDALTGTGAVSVTDFPQYIRSQYAQGVTDEFLPPAKTSSVLPGDGRIRDNDAVIFFNFREDSMRQMLSAFAKENFGAFMRMPLRNCYMATFTEYEEGLPVGVAFPMPENANCLSEMLSRAGAKQLKIAESQKAAHVTCFFNGGKEAPFPFEDRLIYPSDQQGSAENSDAQAERICENVVHAIERTPYECIVANLSGADIAAHTGDYRATLRAVEAVDRAVERIYQAIAHRRGALIITSDHGGAEEMFNGKTGDIKTGHSENPVPLYYVTARNRFRAAREEKEFERRNTQPLGVLSDVAPTVLELLGVKKPSEMTGRSLLGLL